MTYFFTKRPDDSDWETKTSENLTNFRIELTSSIKQQHAITKKVWGVTSGHHHNSVLAHKFPD